MEHFKHDTYIVLELPIKIHEQVMTIKMKFNDEIEMVTPADITIAGSSGVGLLDPAQEPQAVYSILDNIALKIKPIKTSFVEVTRFPSTNIFFFSFKDETPFHDLHREIAHSNIRFLKNEFPFKPHVTLCTRPSITEAEIKKLLAIKLDEEFIIDTLSVCSLEVSNNKIKDHLLYKVNLNEYL
ncbi:2'-5' RNA ligase family protein [Priestia megaterium]